MEGNNCAVLKGYGGRDMVELFSNIRRDLKVANH